MAVLHQKEFIDKRKADKVFFRASVNEHLTSHSPPFSCTHCALLSFIARESRTIKELHRHFMDFVNIWLKLFLFISPLLTLFSSFIWSSSAQEFHNFKKKLLSREHKKGSNACSRFSVFHFARFSRRTLHIQSLGTKKLNYVNRRIRRGEKNLKIVLN